jgi:2-alkenal reductase
MEIDGQQLRVGGDVIVAIDGQPVQTFDELVAYLTLQTEVGQTIEMTVLRAGQEQTVTATLEARPSSEAQRDATEGSTTQGAMLGITGVAITPELAQAMDLPADQEGILIEQVRQGGPADEAGLHGGFKPVTINGSAVLIGGDVITGMDGQPVTQVEDLQAALQQAEPGQKVTLSILRNGQEEQVEVTLGE